MQCGLSYSNVSPVSVPETYYSVDERNGYQGESSDQLILISDRSTQADSSNGRAENSKFEILLT